MFGKKLLRFQFQCLTWTRWCQLRRVVKQDHGLQTHQSHGAGLLTASFRLSHSQPQSPSDTLDAQSAEMTTDSCVPHEDITERGIGRYFVVQEGKLLLRPDQPAGARVLQVAVIGLPNSGKSTLTNRLLGWRVSAVSKKVHTTRRNTTGIITEGNKQIVFLDTPGILSPSSRKRHNLDKTMVVDPERSLRHADLVCVLVDVSNKWNRNELDPLILQTLYLHREKPAVLILNKVDLLLSKQILLQVTRSLTCGYVDGQLVHVSTKKKAPRTPSALELDAMFDAMDENRKSRRQSLEASGEEKENQACGDLEGTNRETFAEPSQSAARGDSPGDQTEESSGGEEALWKAYHENMKQAWRATRDMKGWPYFKRVFMISSLHGDGVGDLKDYLLDSAKAGDWLYHSSLVTSQDPRELVLMCVREKLLEYLTQEIPYNITLDILLWEVDEDGLFNIIMNVNVKNRRQLKLLMGPKGRMIQRIAQEAKQEMMNAFRCEMRLKLVGRVDQKSSR